MIFNYFCDSIVKNLDIKNVWDDESNLPTLDNLILKAILKYENYPSISRIKNYVKEKCLPFFLIRRKAENFKGNK